MKNLINQAMNEAGSTELFAVTQALEAIAFREIGGKRLNEAYQWLYLQGIRTTNDVKKVIENDL